MEKQKKGGKDAVRRSSEPGKKDSFYSGAAGREKKLRSFEKNGRGEELRERKPLQPVQNDDEGSRDETAEEKDSCLIAGRNAVMELLKSGRCIDKLYVKKGERSGSLRVIVAESLSRKIPIAEVESAKLDRMSNGAVHQGVIASASAKEYSTVEDILQLARERGEKPLILIADGIEDPQNLGTLIRVAECAGAHGIILPKHHAVGLTGSVAKASAGALSYVLLARVGNLGQTVDRLKKEGIWIYAAEAGGQPYYACDMSSPAAIILGSEGFGVSRLLLEKSDFRISIPMYGSVNSLNVAAAGAVIVNEAVRQQRGGIAK